VVAGLLIAIGLFFAIFLTKQTASGVKRPVNQHLEKNMPVVTSSDHIKGSADAPIKIVEYSDTDCYYCNLFKPTLEGIINKYGQAGKVAWVYRHFNTVIPAHPHTLIEAEASECVAELGGNDTFWQYIDLLFGTKNFNVQ